MERTTIVIGCACGFRRAPAALQRVGMLQDVAQPFVLLACSERCANTSENFDVDGFRYNM
jgi:hypothetical protein